MSETKDTNFITAIRKRAYNLPVYCPISTYDELEEEQEEGFEQLKQLEEVLKKGLSDFLKNPFCNLPSLEGFYIKVEDVFKFIYEIERHPNCFIDSGNWKLELKSED